MKLCPYFTCKKRQKNRLKNMSKMKNQAIDLAAKVNKLRGIWAALMLFLPILTALISAVITYYVTLNLLS